MLQNFGILTPSHYIGLSLKDAQEKAKEQGFTTRVTEVDGSSLIITEDLKSNRINFRLSNNVVTDVYTG